MLELPDFTVQRSKLLAVDLESKYTQKQLDGSRKKLHQLAAGEVFGEITLVSRIARTADVVALEDSSALAFKWEGIHQIAKVFPRISIKLFQNLSSILGNKLAEVQPEGVMPGTASTLLPPSE